AEHRRLQLGGDVDREFRLQFRARPVDRPVPGDGRLKAWVVGGVVKSRSSKFSQQGFEGSEFWWSRARTRARARVSLGRNWLATSEAGQRALLPLQCLLVLEGVLRCGMGVHFRADAFIGQLLSRLAAFLQV